MIYGPTMAQQYQSDVCNQNIANLSNCANFWLRNHMDQTSSAEYGRMSDLYYRVEITHIRPTQAISYHYIEQPPSQPLKLAMKCVQCRDTTMQKRPKYLSNCANFFIVYGRILPNFHSDSCNIKYFSLLL